MNEGIRGIAMAFAATVVVVGGWLVVIVPAVKDMVTLLPPPTSCYVEDPVPQLARIGALLVGMAMVLIIVIFAAREGEKPESTLQVERSLKK